MQQARAGARDIMSSTDREEARRLTHEGTILPKHLRRERIFKKKHKTKQENTKNQKW